MEDHEAEKEAIEAASERARNPTAEGDAKTPAHQEQTAPFVLVRLGPRWFALPALSVQKVVMRKAITRVPGHIEGVLGIALIQDALVPVVDLAHLVESEHLSEPSLMEPRLVVVGDEKQRVAFVADEAHGVEALPVGGLSQGRGVVRSELFWKDRQVGILDVSELLSVIHRSGESN